MQHDTMQDEISAPEIQKRMKLPKITPNCHPFNIRIGNKKIKCEMQKKKNINN